MFCDAIGPEGYLSVRPGPGADWDILRSFERLAIIEVDTGRCAPGRLGRGDRHAPVGIAAGRAGNLS